MPRQHGHSADDSADDDSADVDSVLDEYAPGRTGRGDYEGRRTGRGTYEAGRTGRADRGSQQHERVRHAFESVVEQVTVAEQVRRDHVDVEAHTRGLN